MKIINLSMAVIIIIVLFSRYVEGQNQYRLLSSKNIDSSNGARRTQYNIEVSSDKNDYEVKKILEIAVKDLINKREVDALSVRLYLENTNLPYAIAYYSPYGDWSKAERGKPKSIFKISIEMYPEHRPKNSGKVEQYGLTSEKRKMIYHEIVQSQKNTRQIAQKKYPDDYRREYEYMKELDKKYENEICKKYGISEDQKWKILEEGVKNNWPE